VNNKKIKKVKFFLFIKYKKIVLQLKRKPLQLSLKDTSSPQNITNLYLIINY